jgi:hypothetical protein
MILSHYYQDCHVIFWSEWNSLPVHLFIAQFHIQLVAFNFCMELMIICVMWWNYNTLNASFIGFHGTR